MSSDLIGVPLLEWLHKHEGGGYSLVGVITHPDKPSGRGKKIHSNPIKAYAEENKIPTITPDKPGTYEVTWLRENKVDLILVIAYGHILKDDFLAAPKIGLFNFHTSLLPKYRGPSPIETAIAEGETLTSISLMEIVKKMDAGGILDTEGVSIENDDTRLSLREKIALACIPLLQRNLQKLLSDQFTLDPQDESQATFTRIIKKEDGVIDFSLPAKQIEARSRAMTPWPGCFFEYNDTVIKVGSCEALDSSNKHQEGEVIEVKTNGLYVGTGQGILKITSLQRPGGKMLSAEEFLRGFSIKQGETLKGNKSRELCSDEPFRKKRPS